MAAEPAAADAVARAKHMPGLRVGLHLVLVEGRPVLPPERVPDLVDAQGFFRQNMVRAGVDFFFRPRCAASSKPRSRRSSPPSRNGPP